MLVMTSKGLYCRPGGFYIDPKGAVDHAVVTHAHSDHARRGSRHYYCEASGEGLLKVRLGQKINVRSVGYGEKFQLGQVQVSLHSAGHILGSAQVRMEAYGEVWVASGDYKRDFDPTCRPFESVACDVFVTEATFGTPAYAWQKDVNLGEQIFNWWSLKAKARLNSVLFAYSLGKAQRVLGVLAPHATRTIYCHPAAKDLTDCYRAQGIHLAPTRCLSEVPDGTELCGELLLVPQAFLKSPQARVLGRGFRTAFASGWMAGGRGHFDHGFVMSDHADWHDLVRTVKETGAKKVYVQHRGQGALVRHLKKLGLKAYPDTALFAENKTQLSFAL
jgi:putative mRNA 3-end processing factor